MNAQIAALHAIDELDVNLGLSQTGRKPAFYTALLRKFVATQSNVMQELGQALQHADFVTAERLAHTLKGVAGSLGAVVLQTSAKQLETAVRQRDSDTATDAALARTTDDFELLMGKLKQALGSDPKSPDLPVVPPAMTEARNEVQEVVNRIHDLLRQHDPAVLDVWTDNLADMHSVFSHANQIDAAIMNFDYQQALTLLSARNKRY